MKKSRTNSLIQDINHTYLSLRQSSNPQNNLQNHMNLSQSLKSKDTKNKRLPFFMDQCSKSTKLSKEKEQAKRKYIKLTNLTKQQQNQKIWKQIQYNKKQNINKNWSYKYYTGNNKIPNVQKTFSILQQSKIIQPFPTNNTKYNIQFLPKTLQGSSPSKNTYISPNIIRFEKFPKRFSSLLKQKQQFNQTYNLRESLFGMTQVDHKKARILNRYQLLANPFKTPKSNELIAKMKKQPNFNKY